MFVQIQLMWNDMTNAVKDMRKNVKTTNRNFGIKSAIEVLITICSKTNPDLYKQYKISTKVMNY